MGLAAGLNEYAYVDGDPVSEIDSYGDCPWCVGALIGGITDIATQLITNGFRLRCISWTEVGISTAAGAVGAGILQKFSKVSTVLKGASRPTYRVFKSKDVLRIEMHPPGNAYPDWFSYPHWHPDFWGKPWSKMHWPLLEPPFLAAEYLYDTNKDDCGCDE
jgi:hypothetical protein